MKRRIVLSGVNITEMGPLMVFRDAIETLCEKYSDIYDIIVLVHKKSLFQVPGATFMEYPKVKSSWFRRLYFEYYECRHISEKIRPHLWFAMDNTSPIVCTELQAVYCHNASPFYSFRIKEALLDWKFGLFTLFFRFLYRINIKANHLVVVQQDWMRSEFRSRYAVPNILVAYPSVNHLTSLELVKSQTSHSIYRFFFPAYPRTFKNVELILDAARKLESSGHTRFEVWLTMNGTETAYASKLRGMYSDVKAVRWLGLLPRADVLQRYADADCLIFPSKLETWGMPITEFKITGKPILVADLPYAHETVGTYDKVAFFDIHNVEILADMMQKAATGMPVFQSAEQVIVAPPFSQNWEELWNILLLPTQ